MNKPLLFEELNWKQLDTLEREKTIFFLIMSPLEEHGPHLPVGTDILISKDIAEEVSQEIEKTTPELKCPILPLFPAGVSKSTADFPGTISMNKKTVRNIVYNISLSLARHRFKYLVIVSFHMDFKHLKAISQAIKKAKRKKVSVCEPLSRFFYSQRKADEILHSDGKETSLILSQYPHLVDKDYTKLPFVAPINFETPTAIFKTIKEMGATEGYLGTPADASKQDGKQLLDEMIDFCARYVKDWYCGKEVPELPKKIRWILKVC